MNHNEMIDTIIDEVINSFNMEYGHMDIKEMEKYYENELNMISFLENLKEKENI